MVDDDETGCGLFILRDHADADDFHIFLQRIADLLLRRVGGVLQAGLFLRVGVAVALDAEIEARADEEKSGGKTEAEQPGGNRGFVWRGAP